MKSLFGIVLAAGTSSRMERAKALLRLDGVHLVEHACRTIEAAGATPVVVVGARKPYILQAIEGRRWVDNDRYAEGMATSVAAGVAEVSDEADAICILPVDQPGIDPSHVQKLLATALSEGLSATRHPDGNLGAPAAFGPEFYSELRQLEGRSGAKSIIAREHPTSFEAEFPQDVDTPEDWRNFVRTYRRAAHRMPTYQVGDGQVRVAGRVVTIEPGGILMVEDSQGWCDLDMFRELGDEDTDKITPPSEDAGLTELSHAAEGVRERLESYMIQGQEFDPDMFWDSFVDNDFVRPFTQGLVWQIWRDESWQSVYVSDECTLITLDDVAIPHSESRFRIPHPLELEDCDAWSQKFAEIELVNSIEQLERPVYEAFDAPLLHHVDPLPFHRIALELGFEPSDTSLNSYSVALTRSIRGACLYLSATPGYPFRFPDDHEQSIELTVLAEDPVVQSEAGLLWDRLKRRLDGAGGYVVY